MPGVWPVVSQLDLTAKDVKMKADQEPIIDRFSHGTIVLPEATATSSNGWFTPSRFD